MMEWPEQDPRVILFRYEDILGKEAWTYWKILSFLDFLSQPDTWEADWQNASVQKTNSQK